MKEILTVVFGARDGAKIISDTEHVELKTRSSVWSASVMLQHDMMLRSGEISALLVISLPTCTHSARQNGRTSRNIV